MGNYATLNPLSATGGTFTQGNLRYTGPNSNRRSNSTISVSTGKWYWEVTLAANPEGQGSSQYYHAFGFGLSTTSNGTVAPLATTDALHLADTGWYKNFSGSWTNASGTFIAGSVLSIAVDLDNNTFEFKHNNSSLVTGTIGGTVGRELTPIITSYSTNFGVMDCNFGQRAFAYAAPSGYKALCTANLPDPTIADGSKYFDAKLYTGNGGTQAVSGLNFSPKLTWIKTRSGSGNHHLFDVVRGVNKSLHSDTTAATETTAAGLTSFDSNGFSIGNSNNDINGNGITFVSWNWEAGSSTVTNSDGSISAQVRANPSAGFSISTYSGSGSNGSFGHGLNATPELVIAKCRNNAQNWAVQHSAYGPTKYTYLNATHEARTTGATAFWNDTAPTNSVVHVGTDNDTNSSGKTYVAYCFAPVEGYSAMGSYTGNGSADGPFVFTGFKVAWLLTKRTDGGANDWQLVDATRSAYNVADDVLKPNSSVAESSHSDYSVDFLSNGFKHRTGHVARNGSGNTYIYLAFASHPFRSSRAR